MSLLAVAVAAMHPSMDALSRLPIWSRRLKPRSVHLGVLQVYKLQLVKKPPGDSPKLLFPAGKPRSFDDSAAQLEQAARDGKPVLMPASALEALLSSDGSSPLQLTADTSIHQLEGRSEDIDSHLDSSEESMIDDTTTGRDALDTVSGGVNALIHQCTTPLSDVLLSDTEQLDWRIMEAPKHTAEEPSAHQRSLLHAAASGDLHALKTALQECTRIDVEQAALPPSGGSALHLAAAGGHQAAVEMLLKAGCSVHAVAVNGSTALHWAAGSGNSAIVRTLLSAGADTRARSSTWRSTVRGDNSGQTAAHWAAASGQTSVLEVLLENDPQALVLEDERQLTLSQVASTNGHGWLQKAMEKLKQEPVVCVHVQREMVLQKPLKVEQEPAGHEKA